MKRKIKTAVNIVTAVVLSFLYSCQFPKAGKVEIKHEVDSIWMVIYCYIIVAVILGMNISYCENKLNILA